MFNIFQYEKINTQRAKQEILEEKLERSKDTHDQKLEHLRSLANLRRLEWASKFLDSDIKNIVQDGSIKLLNSSILECRKDSSDESENESNEQAVKNIVQRMDTKILHPYSGPVHKKNRSADQPKSENLRGQKKTQKKSFNPYGRSYKKNESVWSEFQNYIPNPPEPSHSQSSLKMKSFVLGVKNDVWSNLIAPRESIRTYQSNKNILQLPDAKLYKKSLEQIISRKQA